jgi:hypothetical protein
MIPFLNDHAISNTAYVGMPSTSCWSGDGVYGKIRETFQDLPNLKIRDQMSGYIAIRGLTNNSPSLSFRREVLVLGTPSHMRQHPPIYILRG